MSNVTPEEEEKILNGAPRGTYALLLAFAAFFMGGWIYMYFYMFLTHGPIS